jgi:Helix-turn-helix domain
VPLLDDFYRPAQLAGELGLHPRTLRKLAERNQGPPATRVGRLTLYRKSSVSTWLLDREERKPRGRRK